MSAHRARILLADDHAVVRAGLRMVLNLEPDLEVVDEAGDGPAAVARALRGDIDLAVLDVTMPGLTGLQATRQLVAHRPGIKVVLLSMHDHEEYVVDALVAGAHGYVLKSAADRELVRTIRAVLRGAPFVAPDALDTATRERVARVAAGETPPPGPLTPRETEIVKLVAEGHSSREIAEILHISEKTVERHRANVLGKLELSDRVALTRYAIRTGLVEP